MREFQLMHDPVGDKVVLWQIWREGFQAFGLVRAGWAGKRGDGRFAIHVGFTDDAGF